MKMAALRPASWRSPGRWRPEGRGPADEMGRRWPTTTHHRPALSLRLALPKQRGQAIQDRAPAALVLARVSLLLRIGPGERLVAALHHAKTGPIVALGRQGELNQH